MHDLTFQTVTDPRPPNSPGMAPLDHPDCPLFDVGSITGVFDSAIEGRRIVTRSGSVSLVQVVTHSAGMGSTLNANVAAGDGLIVILIFEANGHLVGSGWNVTDNFGNVWQRVPGSYVDNFSQFQTTAITCEVWYCTASVAGGAIQIMATFNGVALFPRVLAEVAGAANPGGGGNATFFSMGAIDPVTGPALTASDTALYLSGGDRDNIAANGSVLAPWNAANADNIYRSGYLVSTGAQQAQWHLGAPPGGGFSWGWVATGAVFV